MCKKLSCFVLACLLALCMATASQAQDPHNVAMKGTVTVSSTGYGWTPDRAIDGNIDTGSHSADNDPDKWLEVELDQVYAVNAVEVVNRASCCWERIAGVVVKVLDAQRVEIFISAPIDAADALQGSVHTFDNGGVGFPDARYIRLEGGTDFLQIMEVRAMITIATAWAPIPADGAIEVDTTTLEWTLGDTAVSSKVYLSTDATIDDADLLGETALALQVATLDPGATYYWRVDEIDADGNIAEGDVWSFATLPLEAHFQSPADGATNAVSVLFSWTPGKDAIMHNVYFGTDPAMLLPVSMMQMDTTYDPGALEVDTTYYWRVDEFALGVTNAGPVWSFSTAPLIPSADIPDLEAWYTLDQDASSIGVLDMSGNNRHGAILGDPQWVAGQAGSALEFDGSGDYVNIDGYKGINADRTDPDNPSQLPFTVACWVRATGDGSLVNWGSSDGTGVGGQYQNLRIEGGRLRAEHGNGRFRGATVFNDGDWHHVAMAVAQGSNLQIPGTLLFVDGLQDTEGADTVNAQNIWNLTEDADVTIGRRASHGDRYFTGSIDDARIYSRNLVIGEVRALAGVAELPYAPTPADGVIDLEAGGVVLAWNPAEGAVEQDVYLGIDAAAVAAADATETTGIYLGRQAETELALADLGRGVTYFWKVDGVKADGTVMPGLVWNFRIADRNTDNWADTVGADYLDTYVQKGPYDIGAFGGEMTYEFIVQSNPDETQTSMALIGRIGHGDTRAALKYEQWNNTGLYGATVFGVMDYDFGVPTAPGEYTHLVFVSSETAGTTELYVNGELAGSVPAAITLSGIVGIGQAIRDPEGAATIDNFDGSIFGVAIYDRLLTADEIAANADKYFNPIPITDPDLLIYYDFESGEGGMALDQSGHSNHGLFVGTPEWASGPFGGAVSIVLEDVDYIQTAAPLNIVSNTVSITGWVKHDEAPAAWSGILTHRGTSPGNVGLQHNGSELRYMWGADVYWDFSSGLQIPNGEWYFAAVTISPDQGKLYLNGVEQTATNVAPHEPTNFDSLIRVGRDHQDSRIMTSLIDEVKFYNKTLTDVDIQKVFASDVTAPGDTIQGVPNDGDWPGGEYPALAIDDSSGTKYLHRKGGSMATGFQVEPAVGATIVTGLTFTTANDDYGRDPISFELSGSNESIDGPYELIAAGDVLDFAQADLWPRFTTNATAISFENATAYKYYQIVFPTLRDPATPLMQIAEVELLGVPAPLYVEDFESYAAGDQLHGVGGWAGWGGDAGAGAPVSAAFASSGVNSVEVVGAADLVQEFDVAGGVWTFSAMQYIPSGTTGTTYFILLNQYGAANDWSVQTTFNLGTGAVGFWHGGAATIVYDQWVELKYVIDLDNNTVDKYYNGAYVVTDTWDDNAHGTLGAIDLFGNGASSVYYDDIVVTK